VASQASAYSATSAFSASVPYGVNASAKRYYNTNEVLQIMLELTQVNIKKKKQIHFDMRFYEDTPENVASEMQSTLGLPESASELIATELHRLLHYVREHFNELPILEPATTAMSENPPGNAHQFVQQPPQQPVMQQAQQPVSNAANATILTSAPSMHSLSPAKPPMQPPMQPETQGQTPSSYAGGSSSGAYPVFTLPPQQQMQQPQPVQQPQQYQPQQPLPTVAAVDTSAPAFQTPVSAAAPPHENVAEIAQMLEVEEQELRGLLQQLQQLTTSMQTIGSGDDGVNLTSIANAVSEKQKNISIYKKKLENYLPRSSSQPQLAQMQQLPQQL